MTDMHVGDSDREEVSTFLAEKYAGGYITYMELSERLTTAWTARTDSELYRATERLPGGEFRDRMRSAPRYRAELSAAVAPSFPQRLRALPAWKRAVCAAAGMFTLAVTGSATLTAKHHLSAPAVVPLAAAQVLGYVFGVIALFAALWDVSR
jgi:hypothetical protein